MEIKDFTSVFFMRDKKILWSIGVSSLLCLILLFVIQHLFRPAHGNFMGFISVENLCYLQIIPVMILTSLSGYASSPILILIYFLAECAGSHGLPYHAFVLMAGALIANIPVYYHCYRSVWKTLVSIVLSALILGNGWQILALVLAEKMIHFGSALRHFLLALPSCTIVGLTMFIFANFLPKKVQNLFFFSIYESDVYRKLKASVTKKKRHKISVKVTSMILFEALVLIAASFAFANSLFSEFKILDRWGTIVFATRLIILLSIVAIPILVSIFTYANLNITHPLTLMAKAVEDSSIVNQSREGNGHIFIDIKDLRIDNQDEIGILYDSLVETLSNTKNYIKNLERSQLLETQLATAKAASKAKSEFLSNMSHEIRTPINAVLGLNEMILRESSENAIIDYARDVENAGKSLLSIVNDILDFSKIEAGKLEIIPTNYDLSSVINDLVNMCSKRAENKKLKFFVEVTPETPHLLYGDDVRIRQCCLNIMTNAIKYTNEGSVKLSISSKKVDYSHTMLTVHVVDTGIGIKDKDIPKLFTAFQRIEEEKNRTIEGTGLGLNIVQSLLTLMDSRLEVVSVYGEGSDFYFSVTQGVIDWEPIGDFKETYRKKLANTVSYHELFTAPKAKILVVDDTELNLTVVKGLLKQTQIQVDTVISGYDCLDAIQKTHYDIVFLDHRMPGMDGVETFKKMLTLENNKCKGVPVIALTANAVSGAKEMFLGEGFSDYVTKPIESKKLEETILKYLPKDLIENVEVQMDDDDILTLDENGEVEVNQAEEERKKYAGLKGINLDDAMKYTGGPEVFEQAVKEFYANIEKKSSEIENFAAEKDWKNYTILVHALKSSSRLIGAEKLSEDAKYLEKCGDEQNEKEINEKTPALLTLYRSYKENLASLCQSEEDDSSKEEMPLDQYQEAMKNISECAQAFDYDTADQIIAMMQEYKIPAQKEEHFKELCQAVRAVDHDRILKIVLE
ncbi:MAG: response regulator [Treponema sp.]|nr:response regulator [Treponema sp.]